MSIGAVLISGAQGVDLANFGGRDLRLRAENRWLGVGFSPLPHRGVTDIGFTRGSSLPDDAECGLCFIDEDITTDTNVGRGGRTRLIGNYVN